LLIKQDFDPSRARISAILKSQKRRLKVPHTAAAQYAWTHLASPAAAIMMQALNARSMSKDDPRLKSVEKVL
jgi:hypothetical protein